MILYTHSNKILNILDNLKSCVIKVKGPVAIKCLFTNISAKSIKLTIKFKIFPANDY